MLRDTVQTIADTLSNKPEVGIFGSMVGVAMSPAQVISLISAILGFLVALITVAIKVMDFFQKIKSKKEGVTDDYIIIDGHRYKREVDEE